MATVNVVAINLALGRALMYLATVDVATVDFVGLSKFNFSDAGRATVNQANMIFVDQPKLYLANMDLPAVNPNSKHVIDVYTIAQAAMDLVDLLT